MEATVNINGPVVEQIVYDPETGAPTEWPVTTLEMVQDQLRWAMPYDGVRVVINSPGGVVDVGYGMYDLFRSQPVPVTTEAIGQCSSIATVIFLAGQRRRIYPNTAFMIHNPWGGIQGAMQTIVSYAEEIAAIQARMLGTYVERTGADEATLNGMMLEETTIPAEQVRALGFATEVVQPILAQARLSISQTTQAGATPATTNPMTVVRQIPAVPLPGQPAPAATNGQPAAPVVAPVTLPVGTVAPPATNPVQAAAIAAAKKTPLARAWAKAQALFKRGPVRALAVTTEAGDALTIDTGEGDTIAVGQAVVDANGAAAADGDYTLEDGTVITVAGGVIAAVTAPAAASAAPAEPTTLEEAQALIAQLRAGTAAPVQAAAPAPVVAPGTPAPVAAPAAAPVQALANPNANQMALLMQTMGTYMATGAAPVQANDTTSNPAMLNRGGQASSPVADANSTDAKQAAKDAIASRSKFRRPAGN